MIHSCAIEPESVFTLTPPDTASGMRIDRYIAEQFPYYSRTFFQQLINDGHVSLNKNIITKQSTPITPQDTIVLTFPPNKSVPVEKVIDKTMNVSIVHEAEHFMIIHKPAHLLVHAPSTRSTAITLVDWIIHNHNELKHIGLVDRPGIIHRLDKETSGLLIITRTNHAHQVFGNLFQERLIDKTYLAVVSGHPDKEGAVEMAIGRDKYNRIKMAAFDTNSDNHETGAGKIRPAKTHYKVLEYFSSAALVELKPVTGRTHQIRVHMTAIGHPLIGDQLYGHASSLIDRQALHAYRLSFVFDEVPYSFTHEAPDDFKHLINSLHASTESSV